MKREVQRILQMNKPVPYVPRIPFVEESYDINLDLWQQQYVEASPRYSQMSIVASRQSGKTQVTAGGVAHDLVYSRGMMIIISSRSLRQASHYLSKVSDAVFTKYPKSLLPISNRLSLLLPNGSAVIAIPCTKPDTARGFTAHKAIMDEAGFQPDELLRVVTPTLAATSGALHMISSANGPQGFFYEACEGMHQNMYWTRKVHHSECPRITEDFLKSERLRLGDIRFRSEYCAEFLSPEGAFFGWQGMNALFVGDPPSEVGVDFDVSAELAEISAVLKPTPNDLRDAFDTRDRLDRLLS